MINAKDRFRGCLVGLAVGDAVGTTVEFEPRGEFEPVVDMVGGGPFGLKPGQWTDDTSMALCLATSLLASNGFDAKDQMEGYWRWYENGWFSATGKCFDIGMTTLAALRRYRHNGDPLAGSTHPHAAGNGCLMRLAPVPMFFHADRDAAIAWSVESARVTHASPDCVESTRLFASLLLDALAGDVALSSRQNAEWQSLANPRLLDIAGGAYRDWPAERIKGTGYVVDCLEAALWCHERSTDFESAILMATNLGDDADTTAAVCGQIAGACYGMSGIPAKWRERLHRGPEIVALADRLYAGPAAG